MAKFIRKFETNEEFESIYNNPESGYIEPWVSLTESNGEVNYNYNEWEEWYKQKKNPLTLEIVSGGTLMMYGLCSPGEDFRYRINDGEWVVLYSDGQSVAEEGDLNPTVQAGDIVEFLGINTNLSTCDEDGRGFFGTGYGYNNTIPEWRWEEEGFAKFKARGNILSVIDKNNYQTIESFPDDVYISFGLFSWCSALVDASNLVLPIKNFGTGEYPNISYASLFWACKNLAKAPKLIVPDSLAPGCYQNMFGGCGLLTEVPELPITELKTNCYTGMFAGCTGITGMPTLPATVMESSCYENMFAGCTSLTGPISLPGTVLAPDCYNGMFQQCTSLTTAPSLPVLTLEIGCYSHMFAGCTGLTTAPVLPATGLASQCYAYMFYGCTTLTTGPEILATTLSNYCCDCMFYDCTSINYVKCLATSLSGNATRNWFQYAQNTNSCTFVKSASMTGWPRTVSGIPSNWTVQDA